MDHHGLMQCSDITLQVGTFCVLSRKLMDSSSVLGVTRFEPEHY